MVKPKHEDITKHEHNFEVIGVFSETVRMAGFAPTGCENYIVTLMVCKTCGKTKKVYAS